MPAIEMLCDPFQFASRSTYIVTGISAPVWSRMGYCFWFEGSEFGRWEFETAQTSFWFHCVYDSNSLDTDNPPLVFSSNGVDLFRILTRSNGDMAAEYHNDTSWTAIGSDVAVAYDTGVRIDIEFVMSDTVGKFDVYFDGVLGPTLAGGDTIFRGETTIDAVLLQGLSTSGTRDSYFWEPLIADEDTRLFVCQEVPTTGGFHTEWNGGEGDIDDAMGQTPEVVVTTTAGTNTANDRLSVGVSALFDAALDTNHDVIGVVQFATTRKKPVDGFNLKFLTRISSTDYYTDTVTVSPNLLFPTKQKIISVDPSTSLAWASPAAIEAAEFGVQAIGTITPTLVNVGASSRVTFYRQPTAVRLGASSRVTFYRQTTSVRVGATSRVTFYRDP